MGSFVIRLAFRFPTDRIWPKSAFASRPHRTPIHLIQHMARTPSEERKPTTPTITDDQAKELKRLDTILQISTNLKSRELRDKFRRIVINGEMMKAEAYAQVRAFNSDHPMVGLLSQFSV